VISKHNLNILTAGLSAGLDVALLAQLCRPLAAPKPDKVFTQQNAERIAQAEAKRQRKAAKRRSQGPDSPSEE
jgi:hypothetical protein